MTPPWQARLLVGGDEVRSVEVITEHITTDGIGLINWRTQFLDLCQGRDEEPVIVQPLDERPGRVSRSVVRDEPYLTGPQVAVPTVPPAPGSPRYLLSSVTYEGLRPVLDAVCRAYAVSRPPLSMFLLAAMVARRAGTPRVLIDSLYADRAAGAPGIECRMRPVPVPVVVDPDRPLKQALRDTFMDALTRYTAPADRGAGARLTSGPVSRR